MSLTLTSKNIKKVFEGVNKDLKKNHRQPKYFLLPAYEFVLSDRYRGKGRPRSSDYNSVKINWGKRLRAVGVDYADVLNKISKKLK